MKLIPAIDLKDGGCVRLVQGRRDRQTRYSNDPLGVARRWVDGGAARLHLVDLDGAFGEDSPNRTIVRELLDAVEIPCQVGGGLRDLGTVRTVLEAGADAVIIGTAGVREPDFLRRCVERHGADSVIAGVDCREGRVVVQGWEEETDLTLTSWLEQLEELGIERIVHTDIGRDGTEEGPNLKELQVVLDGFAHRVVASGGVGTLEHLESLASLNHPRLEGVIVGKALYEGTFTVEEARRSLSSAS